MKPLFKTIIFLCILHFSLFVFSSFAGIPREISYQGRLTDKDGKPLSEGTVSITFRLYTQESGGSAIWSDTKSVPVSSGGIFSTILGSFPDESVKFDQPYWLGIQIPPDAEMTPRQKLTAAGYAVRAGKADEAEGKIKATGGLIIETRTSDPASPETGQVWLRTDQ
ncbi:MAG: hypothetical protein PHR44_05750 [Candidatus Omnitrophica bacterium]|nr:hypothetical protein [Candidatus Omnitrophota bacterium]